MSAMRRASRLLLRAPESDTVTIDARTPIMAMTTSSSIKVNPRFIFYSIRQKIPPMRQGDFRKYCRRLIAVSGVVGNYGAVCAADADLPCSERAAARLQPGPYLPVLRGRAGRAVRLAYRILASC